MLVLALDTATPVVTVAVAQVGADGVPTRVVERSHEAANRHGELLAPMVDAVLDAAAVRRDQLSAVAVGLGPGPFTGLRVGIVTAAALADALAVPAYGICSLDAIACRGPAGRPLAVVTDARRRQVYWARYDDTGHRVEGPELVAPGELAARLSGLVRLVVGGGGPLYSEQFAAYDVVDAHPYASDLIRLVADRVVTGAAADRLEPMYLRRPDARPPGLPKKVTPA